MLHLARTPAATSCRNPLRVAVDGRPTAAGSGQQCARIAFQREMRCAACRYDQPQRHLPYVDIRGDEVTMGHEATVSKVSENQLFYLMSRGLTEDEAMAMVVRGFVEPIAKELLMEYALELNRLIELQMEGAVG